MPHADPWPKLLEVVKEPDGLPVRMCGSWTEQKLYMWQRYVWITTNAMVGKAAWSGGLACVDMYAGPGVCEVEGTRRRLPGSSLIAAYAPKPFSRIIACELQPSLAAACRQRLQQTPAARVAQVIEGDCNTAVREVVRALPKSALTLAFIDPEGFDVEFETLRALAQAGAVDFLFLFADRIDMVRNIDTWIQQKNSKPDRFLGAAVDWRAELKRVQDWSPENLVKFFLGLFEHQIRVHLGYKGIRREVVRGPNGPLYSMIYASKSERGIDFWEKVTRKELGGQSRLF